MSTEQIIADEAAQDQTTPAEAANDGPPPSEPARARPVFSTDDFALLRTAVLHYLKAIEDSPDSVKYSNLYHRLGRLG